MPYVQVPVPEEHVPAVVALLARLQEGEEPDPSEHPEPSAELVARVYRESGGPHRALFRCLAERSGRWVETDELVESLALPNGSKSMAGLIGAFGRRAKHRYGGFRPWEQEWDRGRGQARYRMGERVAEWVKQAAAVAD